MDDTPEEEDEEEPVPMCWSCLSQEAVAAFDGEHDIVCDQCWQKMSPFERMLLSVVLNPVDDGGLGLRDVSACFTEGLIAALFGPQLPKLETKDVPPDPDSPTPEPNRIKESESPCRNASE